MKGNDQIKTMVRQKFDSELAARISGKGHRRDAFDLEDLTSHIQLKELSGDLLGDVKKVILFADEKRRRLEDFRAWHRNRTDWIALGIAVVLSVGCPLLIGWGWLVNTLLLGPQLLTMAIKTGRKY